MRAIQHGGDIYSLQIEKGIEADELLDFSANINPFGIPAGVKRAMHAAIDTCTAYPDPQCRALISAIAKHEAMPKEWIVCGNGAADLIFRLVYGVKPKKALLLAPTFSEYEEALQVVDCTCTYYTLLEKNNFEIQEDILDWITPKLDMVFLCNPNNPTGQVTQRSLLKKILERCQDCGVTLVIDECFNDFLDDDLAYTMKASLATQQALVILKAFTKMYAIPGVRLGYALTGHQKLLLAMEQTGQAWSVSTLAQAAGVAAVEEATYVQQSKAFIAQERGFLVEALERLGMKVYPPYANYICFKSPYLLDLKAALKKENILIRSCANYKGLDATYYRIGIKDQVANKKLIGALEGLIQYEREKR